MKKKQTFPQIWNDSVINHSTQFLYWHITRYRNKLFCTNEYEIGLVANQFIREKKYLERIFLYFINEIFETTKLAFAELKAHKLSLKLQLLHTLFFSQKRSPLFHFFLARKLNKSQCPILLIIFTPSDFASILQPHAFHFYFLSFFYLHFVYINI